MTNKSAKSWVVALGLAAGFATMSTTSRADQAAPEKTGSQQEQHFEREITITVKLNYLLYLPPDYFAEKKEFPLLVFLHGSGERGNDLNLVKKHGPPKLIEEGKQFTF